MRMFDVPGIEIVAPRRKVFEFLRDPANLPEWAHAFTSAENGRARLETLAGAVDVGLGVTARPWRSNTSRGRWRHNARFCRRSWRH